LTSKFGMASGGAAPVETAATVIEATAVGGEAYDPATTLQPILPREKRNFPFLSYSPSLKFIIKLTLWFSDA